MSGASSSNFLLIILIIFLTILDSTLGILRLSTYHNLMHFYSCVFLLVMHSSYGISSKPQYFNIPVRYFQNNRYSWRVSYSAFFRLIYITGLKILYMIGFTNIFGSNYASNVASVPVSCTRIIPIMSICNNDPGMLHVVTYLFLVIDDTR